MADVVFLGLSHWHVPMHVHAARKAGLSVAGWDPDPAVATGWSSREQAPLRNSVDEMLLMRPRLAVVTGTPHDMPARVRQAVESGIPVLVEKPTAVDTPTLVRLERDTCAAGGWVAVALPHRSGPLVDASPRDVRHVTVRLVNGRPERYRAWGAGWVLDPAVGGGGALRNLGVHGIDLACALLGPTLAVCHARTTAWHGEAVEDHAVVHLVSASGASAVVEAGYLHPDDAGSDFEARVLAAGLLLRDTGDTLVVHRAGQPAELRPVTPQGQRYDASMADVLARIRDGRKPAGGLGDLVTASRLIDEAYSRARSA